MKKTIFILCLLFGVLFFQNSNSYPTYLNQHSYKFKKFSNDSIHKNKYLQEYQKAISFKEQKTTEKDSFLYYINKAIKTFNKIETKDLADADLLYYEKELYYQQQSDFKEALKVANEFRLLFTNNVHWDQTNLIIANVSAGNYNLNLGNFDAAITQDLLPNLKLIDSLEKTKETAIHPTIFQNGKLLSFNFLILNYSNNGEIKKALSYIDSIKVFLNTHPVSENTNPILEDVYTTIIDTYLQQRANKEALYFVRKYDTLYANPTSLTKLRIEDKKRKIFYAAKKYDSVLATHQKTANIYHSLAKPNQYESFYYGKSLEQTALVYDEHFYDPTTAIAYLKEATHTTDSEKYTTYSNPLFSYSNLISIYQRSAETDTVSYYLTKLDSLSHALKNKSYIAQSKGHKAEFYFEKKNFDQITKNNNAFFELMQWQNADYFLKTKLDSLPLTTGNSFLKQTLKIAEINHKAYLYTKKTEYLQVSNKLYAISALMLNDQKIATILNETENSNFEVINNGLLETLYLLDNHQQNFSLLAEGLEMLELNQNLNLIFNNYLNKISFESTKVSKPLIRKKNQTESKYKLISNELEDFILNESNKVEYDLKLNQQYQLKITLDSIYQIIKKEDALFYSYNNARLKLKDFKQKLNAKHAVLRYFFSEKSLFVFVIENKEVSFYQLSNRAEIETNIHEFYTSTIQRNSFESETLNQLIPVQIKDKNLEQLTVVPHKNLNLIPFEALSFSSKTTLVERFKVNYIPSLNLFPNKNDITSLKMVSFVPDYMSTTADRVSLTTLAAAQKEAKMITSLLQGDIFEGKKATKSNFLKATEAYNMFHLAMHTNYSGTSSNQANLIFYSEGKTTSELSIQDIYNLSITSKLSVLSACNTGIGDEDPSEGIQSLARAFHYAGSDAVVMSLWKVPDRETSIIMESFYTYLKNGKPKDQALQLAKKEYLANLEDPMLKHPYYWAGFVLSGNTQPITETSSSSKYSLALLGFVIAVVFIKRYVKRTKNVEV